MIKYSAIVIKWEYPIIITGKRHCDCLATARNLGIDRLKIVSADQGFLTHHLEYLNRSQAAVHVIDCGQLEKLTISQYELFSEDLY